MRYSSNQRSWTRRTAAAFIAVAATLVAVTAPGALAEAPSTTGIVERETVTFGYFVEGDGIIAVTGPPFAEGCLEEGFLESIAISVNRPNETILRRNRTGEDLLSIYEGDSFLEDLLFPSCDAVLDDDPTTMPAQPFATGTGVPYIIEQIDEASGTSESRLHIRGTVNDGETTWKVVAFERGLFSFDTGPIEVETSVKLIERS